METESQLLLLEKVRRGDRQALGHLLEDLRPYVRVIVRSLNCGRPSKAKDESDLIQDALMQATQSIDTFRGVTLGEWLGWLRTIAVRTTYRSMASAKGVVVVDPPHANLATLFVDKAADPRHQAVRNETAARMASALSRLPDEMQQVLLGRLIDDLDHVEIAVQLGRSPGAVRMLYLRALRRLREVWQTEFSSGTGTAP